MGRKLMTKMCSKYIPLFLIPFLILSCDISKKTSSYSKDIEFKVDSLMNLMTLQEKIGQTVMYSGDWSITGPTLSNENKNSFTIEKIVMSLSNKDASRKVKLDLDYKHSITTILKDSKGDPSKKKLSINIILIVKDDNDNVLANKRFGEEFNYVVQSDKFSMTQYEDNIVKNLNNKISNDIVFLLGTLK